MCRRKSDLECYKDYFGSLDKNEYRQKYIDKYELLKGKYSKYIKIRMIRELENQKAELITYRDELILKDNIDNTNISMVSMLISMIALVISLIALKDCEILLLIMSILIAILFFLIFRDIRKHRKFCANLCNKLDGKNIIKNRKVKSEVLLGVIYNVNLRIQEICITVDVLKDLLIKENNFTI